MFVYLFPRCGECPNIILGAKEFRRHLRIAGHLQPLHCGECQQEYEHQTSLMRHIRTSHYHADLEPNEGNVAGGGGGLGAENVTADENLAANEDEDVIMSEDDHQEQSDSSDEDVEFNLHRTAGEMVLNLRQTGNITGSAIERFQEETYRMLQVVARSMKKKVKTFLLDQNMYTPDARNMLRELTVEDPFEHIKTLKQQLNFFASEFGLVKPQTKFLKYRIDYRLNPLTAQYEPTRVPMSFEYLSLTETLTTLLNNPKIRGLIEAEAERHIEDGVLRCYLDGSRSKEHQLVIRFPGIIRLEIYWDDIEVVNPLGSKTSVHKIAAFYFSIQNLPAVENSQLSSVYLLALAYSQDLKIPGGFEKILAPFLYELRKLESERGVMIQVNGQPYRLRATLTVLCADTLAAHEILGFLSPSARHFCRKCMISRADFRLNLNLMGEKRTRAMFDEHVEAVNRDRRFSTNCGVRTSCPLHLSKSFDATQDAVQDVLHDLLEGVCHWVVSLALRSFVANKYFTLEAFNGRVAAFNYGVPDSKNKPSANFTEDSLKGSKLKQKGSQMWCLIRAFGFLVADVPEGNRNLKVVNLLQRIMLITFAEGVRPDHIDMMENLITEHHSLFQELYVTPEANALDELSDSEEEEDEGFNEGIPAEVAAARAEERKKLKKVKPGNKLHHMKHFAEEMRKFGSLIRYWCMRYEGRHHIFCKYGAVCCNFINIVKSMAQMFQISTLAGLLKTSCRADEIELQSYDEVSVGQCCHRELLLGKGLRLTDIVFDVDAVKIAGEDYRPGLFVLTEASTPTFALIQKVYTFETQVFFVVDRWQTVEFNERYCAYEVMRTLVTLPIIITRHCLARHGAFAPWNPWGQKTTFIAPRTIIF